MNRFAAGAVCLLGIAAAARAESPLEERIRALEIRTPAAPGTGLGVSFKDGLHVRAAGNDLDFRIGGHVVAHGIFHQHGERHGTDTLVVREAQLELDGRVFERFSLHAAVDLAPGVAGRLFEGYAEFNAWDVVRLRAGLFLVPYSPEALEPLIWQDFPENGLTDLHAPFRDMGVLAYSTLFDGILDFSLGVTNGNGADGADDNGDKDVVGYFGVSPLAWTGWDWLRGFRIGFGGTTGRHEALPDRMPVPAVMPQSGSEIQTGRAGKLPGDQVVREDGRRTRATADLSLSLGPVDFGTQISRFKTGLRSDGHRSDYRSWANRWQLGFWIFGYRNTGQRPTIENPLFAGGPGGLQVAARYSTGTFDDDFIRRGGFAGAETAREYSLAVNWYPNPHVRVSLMLSEIRYSRRGIPVGEPLPPQAGRGAASVPGNDRWAHHTDREKILLLRVQVDF